MSLYELLLLLHVTAVIIWLGAGFLLAVMVLRAERAGDHAKEAMLHGEVPALAPLLFIPASLATLILGILLVVEGSWGFDQPWIVIALCGWAISFGLGFLYFRPEGGRIAKLAEQHGPDHPEIGWRVHRLNVVDRLQVGILFLVVADMVLKPTTDDAGLLIAGAAVLAAAIALAAASIRKGPSLASAEAESAKASG